MRRLVFLLSIVYLLCGCGSDDAQPPQELSIHINSGGPAFTFGDTHWEADRGNTAMNSYENAVSIEGTENDVLYQTEVFDRNGFTYEISVSGEGPWRVDLHFAEIFHGIENTNGAGSRIFNVEVEGGQAQLSNYDILVAAGAPATAIIETFTGIDVQDGSLTLSFTSVEDAAKLSGVEISTI